MVTSEENLGWVQKMMGHASLKMIVEKYYTYIPNMTHNDGSLFVKEYEDWDARSTPSISMKSQHIDLITFPWWRRRESNPHPMC